MQPSNKTNQLSLFDDEPQEATTAALEPVEEPPVAVEEPQEAIKDQPVEEPSVEVEEPQEAIGAEQDQADEDERERAKLRALWTKHFVQAYRMVKVKRKRRLEPADRLAVSSADAALERAERLFESGRYEGVVAYTVTTEPGGDEYGETECLVRLGKVAEDEE